LTSTSLYHGITSKQMPKRDTTDSEVISFRITSKQKKQIEDYAKAQDISLSEVYRMCITSFFENAGASDYDYSTDRYGFLVDKYLIKEIRVNHNSTLGFKYQNLEVFVNYKHRVIYSLCTSRAGRPNVYVVDALPDYIWKLVSPTDKYDKILEIKEEYEFGMKIKAEIPASWTEESAEVLFHKLLPWVKKHVGFVEHQQVRIEALLISKPLAACKALWELIP
jgi:hypothetical protein